MDISKKTTYQTKGYHSKQPNLQSVVNMEHIILPVLPILMIVVILSSCKNHDKANSYTCRKAVGISRDFLRKEQLAKSNLSSVEMKDMSRDNACLWMIIQTFICVDPFLFNYHPA